MKRPSAFVRAAVAARRPRRPRRRLQQEHSARWRSCPPASPASADANAGNWRMIVADRPQPVHRAAARRRRLRRVPGGARLHQDRPGQPHRRAARGHRLLERRRRAALEPDPARAGGPLQPAAGARGTTAPTRFPDANNPFADPAFPFANPPYAARAYSYVTVAQFEALKVAWSYKYQYNRPSPSQVDSGVQALMPATDLPAYPSEDAVLSGVSTEMLRLLFPAAVEEITPQGRRAAGGRARCRAARRRATSPPGSRSGGRWPPCSWPAPARTAWAPPSARRRSGRRSRTPPRRAGEIPWTSLETPPRPPMLPNFGQVRAWMMTPDRHRDRAARAAPVDVVRADAAGAGRGEADGRQPHARAARHRLQVERRRRHLHAARATGTTSPPSTSATPASARCARPAAFALLNMAMHDAAVGCWDAKFAYFNPRPSQLDPEHQDRRSACRTSPSYTSGHSTFSGRGRGRALVPLPGRRRRASTP